MKTILVDTQEFHTSEGILKIETRISEISKFGSAVENKFIFNNEEFSNTADLERKIGSFEYECLRYEIEEQSKLLDLYMQAYPKTL